jgi:hypothetical protein
MLKSLPLKIVGGQTPREKSWGDRLFGGVRIFVDDSHFESDPFAGKKMSGPIREAVERLYRPLICCDATSALIRHQHVVSLGSCVNERRAFAITRRVYCACPGARAAGTTAGDTGHVTSDDTIRDRQRLPSATWGVSRVFGHRRLESARSLCCPQRDKHARNPSFLFRIFLRIFGSVLILELGIETDVSVNLLFTSTSDNTMSYRLSGG